MSEKPEALPRAWMRRWAFDLKTPQKERNGNGRMAWPMKYKFLPVTTNKVLDDDVPLYDIGDLAKWKESK